jgi:hypothetical protein
MILPIDPPRAYYIAKHIITDPNKFEEYRVKVLPMIEKYDGRGVLYSFVYFSSAHLAHLVRPPNPRRQRVELGPDRTRWQIRGALSALRFREIAVRKDVEVTGHRKARRAIKSYGPVNGWVGLMNTTCRSVVVRQRERHQYRLAPLRRVGVNVGNGSGRPTGAVLAGGRSTP